MTFLERERREQEEEDDYDDDDDYGGYDKDFNVSLILMVKSACNLL